MSHQEFNRVVAAYKADPTPTGLQALLRDQLCNPDSGAMHDTVILAHMVDETWSTMLTGGFEEALW